MSFCPCCCCRRSLCRLCLAVVVVVCNVAIDAYSVVVNLCQAVVSGAILSPSTCCCCYSLQCCHRELQLRCLSVTRVIFSLLLLSLLTESSSGCCCCRRMQCCHQAMQTKYLWSGGGCKSEGDKGEDHGRETAPRRVRNL